MAYVTEKMVSGKGGKERKRYLAKWKQDGKEREKAFDMKREAKAYAAEMQAKFEGRDLSDLQDTQRKKVVFEDLMNDYLRELEEGKDGGDPLEGQTLRTYRRYLENHALPYFRLKGGVVASITKGDMEELRTRCARVIVSARSIREVLRLTKAVLAYGVGRGVIDVVPGADVTIKTTRLEKAQNKLNKDQAAFTPPQLAALLAAADSLAEDRNRGTARAWQLYRPLAYFLAHTGVRISEARGFPRSAFDKTNDKIHIRQRAAEKGEIGVTKSAEGIRSIPLHDDLIAPLEAALKLHNRDLLFGSAKGTPRSYHNLYNRMLTPLVERANKRAEAGKGVPVPALGFHAFRHSFAARLIKGGANLKQLQVWMGHHDPAFTLKEYGHLFEDAAGDQAIMARMTLPS
jgi:integrase